MVWGSSISPGKGSRRWWRKWCAGGKSPSRKAPEAVKQLLGRAQEAQTALVDKVKELVAKALAETKPARAADLEALAKRVAALEEEIKKHKHA